VGGKAVACRVVEEGDWAVGEADWAMLVIRAMTKEEEEGVCD